MNERKTRVCLIDDSDGDYHLVMDMLNGGNQHNYQINRYCSLSEGVGVLADQYYDVLLLDLYLPDSQGLDTFETIDNHDFDIPVVVLSGMKNEMIALKAVQAGAQDYLIKGEFNNEIIRRAIEYAVERHQLKKQLVSLSITDDLTKLHNRRGFITLAEQQIKSAGRTETELLLIVVDVDGLKQINDQHGHRVGDQALITTADTLRNTFREADIIGRIGGDEFAVLAVASQDNDKRTILKRLESTRDAMQQADRELLIPEVSVGIVSWKLGDKKSLSELMQLADAALYSHKQDKRGSPGQITFPSLGYQTVDGFSIEDVSEGSDEIRLLVVEDNPADARLVLELLKESDVSFLVSHVERKSEALACLQKETYSLMLLDLSLPDSHGLETVESILSEAPDIPIVVMTGLDDKLLATKALQLGAQDYLIKGTFDEVLLGRTIPYAIERHRLHVQNKLIAQELMLSEARFRRISEENVDGLIVLSKDQKVLFCNQAAGELYGETHTELEGRKVNLPVGIKEAHRITLTGHRLATIHVDVRQAEIPWWGATAYLTALRDVTEMVLAQEAISRQAEDLGLINTINDVLNRGFDLHTVIDILQEGTRKVFDGTDCTIYLLNDDKTYLKPMGYSISPELGEKIEKLINIQIPEVQIPILPGSQTEKYLASQEPILVESPEEIEAWVEDFIETPSLSKSLKGPMRKLVPTITKMTGIKSMILTTLNADGETIGLLSIASKGCLSQSDVWRFATISKQITTAINRKLIEDQLLLQSAALDAAANAIVITDRNGDITWINQAFTDLTGYGEEKLGENPSFLKSGLQNDAFYKQLWDTILGGQTWFGEITNRRKNGDLYNENMTISPLTDSGGKITHFIAIKQDITARKKSEQIVQRQLDELSILHAVAVICVEEHNEDTLIERVTDIIAGTLYSEHFGVVLIDDTGKALIVHPSFRGLPDEYVRGKISLDEGIVGPVAASGISQRIPDVSKEVDFIAATPGIKSGLYAPLKAEERVLGVIISESAELDFFSEDDERLLATLAGQLATAIERIRKREAEHEQRLMAEALSSSALALNSSLNIEEILDQILSNIARMVPYDVASLMLNENGNTHVIRQIGFDKYGVSDLVEDLILDIDEFRILREMQATGKPIIVQDVTQDARWLNLPQTQQTRAYLGVPILKDDSVIGFLNLDHTQQGFFTENHARSLQGLAHQLSMALENARLFDETQKNLRELSLLFEASRSYTNAKMDPTEIALEVTRQFVEVLNFFECTISLLDPSGEILVGIADYYKDQNNEDDGRYWSDWIGQETKLADYPATARVLKDKEPLIVQIDDPEADAAEIAYIQSESIETLIILPLISKGKSIGVIEIEEEKQRIITPRELNLVMTLANQVATTLENARLYAETEQNAGELSRLYNASGILLESGSTDLDELSGVIVDTLLSEFGQSNCSLFLIPSDRKELDRVAASGAYQEEIFKGSVLTLDGPGLVPICIRERKIINVPDVTQSDDYVPNWTDAHSEMAIPLFVGDEVIGAIDVQSAQIGAFSKDDERIVSVFAERAALALENARLYEGQQRQLAFLEALHHIDLAITGSMDLNVTMDVISGQVASQLDADALTILMLDSHALTLEPIASYGFAKSRLPALSLRYGEGLGGLVAQKGRAIFKHELDGDDPECIRMSIFRSEEIKAYHAFPLLSKGKVKGVLEVFHRDAFEPDPEWSSFAVTVATQTAIAIDNATLFEDLERSNLELSLAYDTTLEGWAKALELRDHETEGHARRVVDLTMRISRDLGINRDELLHIRRGALLHDIGKMGVPDRILQKDGPLTDDEWAIMRQHPVYAYEWLSSISYLEPALDIPHYHHERWDGTGYPEGLKGEQIPLAARIFAIVDVWDALRSDRPYRKAWSVDEAVAHIKKQSGSHFDPQVVDAFLNLLDSQDVINT